MTQTMRTTGRMGSRLRAAPPLLVLGAGAALSLLVGALMYMAAERADARRQFDAVARSAQSSLAAGIRSYTDLLRGAAAVFQSVDAAPGRLQFRRYVRALELRKNFPALDAMSFASYVTEAGRVQFIAAVRADRSADPGGYPGFTIHPPGRRLSYTVLNFVEPTAPYLDRMGTDLAADPGKAAALDNARDHAQLVASDLPPTIALPKPHNALSMRLPVYRSGAASDSVQGRREAYLGLVGIGFSVPALVKGVLDDTLLRGVHVAVYADTSPDPEKRTLVIGKADRLLSADIGQGALDGEHFETVLPVDFNGSLWKAQFRVPKNVLLTSFERYAPLLALLIGSAGTMLIYAFFTRCSVRAAAL